MFPRVTLTISEHWFRLWLGADPSTSHYLNQWWPDLLMHICVTRPQWVKMHRNLTILTSFPGLLLISSPALLYCMSLDRIQVRFIRPLNRHTIYPKKYAHSLCFAVLCCGYTLTDFPISTRLTSLALCQSNDCPSASKTTLMNMDKYFMWIHYERLHNHNKAKHNKTVCIFHGIYCNMVDGSHLWNASMESDVIIHWVFHLS